MTTAACFHVDTPRSPSHKGARWPLMLLHISKPPATAARRRPAPLLVGGHSSPGHPPSAAGYSPGRKDQYQTRPPAPSSAGLARAGQRPQRPQSAASASKRTRLTSLPEGPHPSGRLRGPAAGTPRSAEPFPAPRLPQRHRETPGGPFPGTDPSGLYEAARTPARAAPGPQRPPAEGSRAGEGGSRGGSGGEVGGPDGVCRAPRPMRPPVRPGSCSPPPPGAEAAEDYKAQVAQRRRARPSFMND